MPDPEAFPPGAVSVDAGGITLTVWAQPRASCSEVVGWQQNAFKVRLAAPPVEGKANAECVALIAAFFGVPRRQVSLVQGQQGRHKKIRIEAPADLLLVALQKLS